MSDQRGPLSTDVSVAIPAAAENVVPDLPPVAGIGKWASVAVWGKERYAHFEVRQMVDGTLQFVATIYKGGDGGMLSAEYWRGISDSSIQRALAAASELIAAEGPPPESAPASDALRAL